MELILDEQDGVLESAAIGVPHPDFGETVVAVLVKSGVNEPNIETIKGKMKTSLASFKQPRHYVVVDELPRNTMGKVQKNVLRDTY